uniref:Uncharacterized protein n=2 Tax=viral metagenome TaxID=1070528 RepID=A0A6M3J609_9ZZZZ
MLKNLIFFGLGFLVARYLIVSMGSENYVAKEKSVIDLDKFKAWLKKTFPDMSDTEVDETVNDATNSFIGRGGYMNSAGEMDMVTGRKLRDSTPSGGSPFENFCSACN